MKKFIVAIFTISTFMSCAPDNSTISTDIVANPQTASGEEANAKLPDIKFEEELFEFGEITQGEKVEHTFMFTNTGEADLIVTSAKGSCGCTVPDYPKQPLKPGESAPIKVTFDPAGKSGMQSKTVTLTTNTENGKETFVIKANVKAGEGTTPAKSRTKTIIN
jgi:hypothetical protein